ncbi:MAG: macro domain-containing protein [Campylobacterales bacterium]|nr:macro domain-containing protein [Campylobacterales bacterium]
MAYRITIKEGNLLDTPSSDFIVNPSNTILSLGSGVSGAFAATCGSALQEEMNRKKRSQHPL